MQEPTPFRIVCAGSAGFHRYDPEGVVDRAETVVSLYGELDL